MKYFIVLLLFFMLACTSQEIPVEQVLQNGQWIDLSYDFSDETIYWPTAETFKFDTVFAGFTDSGFYYTAYQYCAAEHGGTHLDAPIHFAEGKKTIDQLAISQLVGPAVVIDVSDKALDDRDYQVSTADFQAWEATHGNIPDGSIILLRTGSGKFWPDREKYMGTAELGPEAVAKLHFPGLAPDAATWLVENRKIKAIGLDSPSIDYGQSTLFESHQILFKENIPAFENVANLEKLPETGAFIIALPMKIKDGSGGPLRIVAFLP